ncbi:MAG: PAS domain S-box protein [Desulfomonile tiedjei]|nr:PAS domain S-box protein [Desulfomonile tiedjei]
MNQQGKTKEQLIEELRELHRRTAVLESCLAALNHDTGLPTGGPSPRETGAPGAQARMRGTTELAEANGLVKAETEERKQAETALGLSEETYRRLVENINDVIFSLDVQGRFTYISPVIERFAHYDVSEVIGQPFYRFVHPDDLDIVWEKFKQTLAGNLEAHEFRVFAKDGSLIHVRTSSRPLWEGSRLVGLTGVMADITERKKAEEALWESESNLRTLMDLMPDPLVVYDPQGCVTYVNDAFVKTYGWSQDELLGTRIDFVPPEEAEKTRAAWERTMRREPILFETRRFTKDRKLLDIEATTAVLLDQQGNHQASIVIHRDVTDRKRAEERLRKANAELESFSYSVSHDLRAPLRGIDGWSLALLEDCADQLDERGRKHLERVRSETQRMGKLIDDLLELSRVTRADMRREEADLSSLVRSIAARLKDAEPDRQVDFVIQPGLTVHGDARLLEILLGNLFDNAWKFTGKHASARIEFGRTETEGQTTYFVRDDGAGFDMAYARKLFGAFQRMHKTSEFPGTGVGLATVQRIVHRHDGRVWAEAEVEKGATFYFTL